MFDMEKHKRDQDLQRSEAVVHYKREQDVSLDKLPEGYKPHWSERDEQTRPRELFSMGNSYGDISFAANRNKEMLLTFSQKRQHNSETLPGYQKQLNGERRRSVPNAIGRTFTNSYDPGRSAFAFKTGKLHPTRRVLAYLNKYVEQNDQETVETLLPFMRLQKDKKRMQWLASEVSQGRKEKDPSALEREKEQLSHAVSQKEQMQRRFFKKMEFALKKARLLEDEGRPAWLQNVVLTEETDIPDTPTEDEDQPSSL